MNIICNDQIKSIQLNQLKMLSTSCDKADGGLPSIYWHLLVKKRLHNSNVFYYNGKQLIGFLSVYFFYQDTCEITLLVHPQHRHHNVARQLLKNILFSLTVKQMQRVIFSMPIEINTSWLTNRGFIYKHRECHMERIGYKALPVSNTVLQIRTATAKDIPWLKEAEHACFPGTENNPDYISILNDKVYTLLIATLNDQLVGKAQLRWHEKEAFLSDVAVLPEFQRRGFGSTILVHCINHAHIQEKAKLILDVLATNIHAVHLYSQYGFKITQQHDYWYVMLSQLTTMTFNS